jgi:hypothetical protein
MRQPKCFQASSRVSQINTKETRPAELRVRPRPHKQASHFFAVSRTAALAFVPGSYLLPAVLPSYCLRASVTWDDPVW